MVIGHSFGGLIAQELLAGGHAAAAVAIDPAPIKGVKALPLAQLRSAFPVLGNPANRHRTVSLNAKQFHYAFGNMLSEEESDALHDKWTIPGPGRPLFEDAAANFVQALAGQGRHPSGRPRTAAADVGHRGPHGSVEGDQRGVRHVRARAQSDTEFHEFPGRGHSLTIDNGWRDVADVALNWLAAKGF